MFTLDGCSWGICEACLCMSPRPLVRWRRAAGWTPTSLLTLPLRPAAVCCSLKSATSSSQASLELSTRSVQPSLWHTSTQNLCSACSAFTDFSRACGAIACSSFNPVHAVLWQHAWQFRLCCQVNGQIWSLRSSQTVIRSAARVLPLSYADTNK